MSFSVRSSNEGWMDKKKGEVGVNTGGPGRGFLPGHSERLWCLFIVFLSHLQYCTSWRNDYKRNRTGLELNGLRFGNSGTGSTALYVLQHGTIVARHRRSVWMDGVGPVSSLSSFLTGQAPKQIT